jgi:hypothetical protein
MCAWNILGRDKSLPGNAGVLIHDDASERRKIALNTVLLDWPKKVTDARGRNSARLSNNLVRQDLAIARCKNQDTPQLLCALFSCH